MIPATLAYAVLADSIAGAMAGLGTAGTLVLAAGVALGIALWVIEMFAPHGVAATIGTICLAAAVYVIFATHGPAQGAVALAGAGVTVVALAMLAARRITSKHRQDERYTVAGPQRMAMVGKRARSVSALRPGGVVEVATEGGPERVDAITRGEWIAPDTEVEVVAIEVNFVVVKAAAAPAA